MSDIKVPEMGESIVEGTISKWHVKTGDSVNIGDVLAELETDKVNIEISAEQAGTVESLLRSEGDTVAVGETIGVIGSGAGAAAPAASQPAATAAPVSQPAAEEPEMKPATPASPPVAASAPAADPNASISSATPAARKLARERGIDLTQVQSLDPLGRIRQSDIESHGTAKPVAVTAPAPATAAPSSAPAAAEPGKPAERRKMSRRRITIAKRLVEAQHTAAMLTTFNEVDMTAILDVRKRRKQAFLDKHEVGLGFMSFFTKAVIGALKAFPLLNAEIQGDEILVKQYYDIGIAVSAKEGLVVPVVRDADRLGFAQIEKQIGELAGKARANTLSLNDLQGGTFTITNGGVFGSLLSTPILNAPQVGILGMHKIQIRPVAINATEMENRPMMYIALSYDHRIVDGSEAVRFLVTVKELLEDPESLLLEG
ncbi:2-oxoglutarate dehydrogenase complex dihydrolipoyllysine-residue succinyltransferase [Paenibacillus sacheonensis]|uniref:Dihydrolipoyllysine-residue succinyltransferase component of 2-oxoglutarate dehydrogenase complex n=1 Tax=Paenibacillus sacheonensis TaxID=742054 RepID=A0A7X5BZF6_9BACL|nr:2-oxoglutarate dehydrogenase complex dihydrolipoyllysine-residue succinyltransferase [Paenibacillus sacheonensis]MBM7563282.1 2-oxoglutarate dehydrogenase E2 component (dihydrolipoamide succinyltransferase) [Paenibacillus sacheonensis]NBC68160.1 2-oxoglutarate dehydrogenase complex dihydrolipoyllysine-residue succinyltransferase [Paenibacillus sacheonensis]